MHLKSTAGCQISSLIFGFSGGPYKYPLNNCRGTAKFFHTWVYIKGIVRIFKWLKCFGGILHLKPTAGCPISTLIFGLRGGAINIPWKIAEGRQIFSHLGLKSKVLSEPLTDLSAWMGFCTSSPQQGVKYQLCYFDFGEGYKYPIKIVEGRQSSFPLRV